jgi:hypothetical protein
VHVCLKFECLESLCGVQQEICGVNLLLKKWNVVTVGGLVGMCVRINRWAVMHVCSWNISVVI